MKKVISSAKLPAQVRIGVQLMNNEIIVAPERAVQMRLPNLIQFKIVDDAGHFAAFEKPLETAKNFVEFIFKSF